MLDKIFVWLRKYNLEITWFLIGFLFLAGGTGGVGDYTDVIKDLYK